MNASGGATRMENELISSGVILVMSISARNGSPSADRTVMEPRDKASALLVLKPNSVNAARATAVFRQQYDLVINLYASGTGSV